MAPPVFVFPSVAFKGNPWHDQIGRFAPKGTGRMVGFDGDTAADLHAEALSTLTDHADEMGEAYKIHYEHGAERESTFTQARDEYLAYGSSEMDRQLRANGDANVVDAAHSRALTDAVVLDEAINRSGFTFTEDVVLLRGVRNTQAKNLTAGTTFTDPAFVSVTASPGEAAQAAGVENRPTGSGPQPNPGTLVALRIPAGTKAMPGVDLEKEFVLPRGGVYTVVDVVDGDDGVRIAQVSVEFPDTPPVTPGIATIDDMIGRVGGQRERRRVLDEDRSVVAAAGGNIVHERLSWDLTQLGMEGAEMTMLTWSVSEFGNPWHDEEGRFAPKGAGTRSTGTPTPETAPQVAAPAVEEPPVGQGGRTTGADTKALADQVVNGQDIIVDPVDADDVIKHFADHDGPVDLTAVTIDGMPNMFSAMRTLGVPRDQMPQITPDVQPQWQDFLRSQGIKFGVQMVDPASMSATQSELNGQKVGGMIKAMEAGTMSLEGDPLMGSNDAHVLDGHHRWAGTAAMSADCGGCIKIPVMVIDLPIVKLLPLANKWVDDQGIARAGVGDPSKRKAAGMSPWLLTVEHVSEFVTKLTVENPLPEGEYVKTATDTEDGITPEDTADLPHGNSGILTGTTEAPAAPAPTAQTAIIRQFGLIDWEFDATAEFMNPWHDEIGRFAPKGTGRAFKDGRQLPLPLNRDADGKIIVSDEAKALARPLAEEAARLEPEVTRRLAQLIGDSNPEVYDPDAPPPPQLYGYEFAKKQEEKIAEKIERVVEEKLIHRPEAAADIKDALRYTVHFTQDEFGRRSQEIIDQLAVDNADVVVKNTWPPGKNPYKGVNVNVTTDDGFTYEIQFHTPESQAVKDQMHEMYDEARVLPDGHPRRIELEDEMMRMGEELDPPTGAYEVTQPRRRDEQLTVKNRQWRLQTMSETTTTNEPTGWYLANGPGGTYTAAARTLRGFVAERWDGNDWERNQGTLWQTLQEDPGWVEVDQAAVEAWVAKSGSTAPGSTQQSGEG